MAGKILLIELATQIVRDVLTDVAAPNDLIAVGQYGRFRRSGFGSAMRSLVEGGPCPLLVVSGELRLVTGSRWATKVTYPEDIAVARAMLADEGRA